MILFHDAAFCFCHDCDLILILIPNGRVGSAKLPFLTDSASLSMFFGSDCFCLFPLTFSLFHRYPVSFLSDVSYNGAFYGSVFACFPGARQFCLTLTLILTLTLTLSSLPCPLNTIPYFSIHTRFYAVPRLVLFVNSSHLIGYARYTHISIYVPLPLLPY